MINTEFVSKRLEIIEDIFVFSCFTGLANIKRNQKPLYTYSQLYRFLKDILEKYYKTDNGLIPAMRMIKTKYYLCLKHVPQHEKDLTNSDTILIKQALKKLVKNNHNNIF